ncbi:MAG: hypothetical protein PHX68_02240 [Alphaproteobacteria bacterium]|nr:hypothetical protein [Alphaproteobacteria bacterium]
MSRLFSDASVPIWEQCVAQTPQEKAYYKAGMARVVMRNWGYDPEIRGAYGALARSYRYDRDMESLFKCRMVLQSKALHLAVNQTQRELLCAQEAGDIIACKAHLAHLAYLTPFLSLSYSPRSARPIFFLKLQKKQLEAYLAAERQQQR